MNGPSASLLLLVLLVAGRSDARLTAKQKQVILKMHNDLRSRVSPKAADMVKLTWDSGLARKAQGWANRCNDGHNGDVSNGRWDWIGENMAFSTAADLSRMVLGWQNEKKIYSLRSDTCRPVPGDPMLSACGHYTQVGTFGWCGLIQRMLDVASRKAAQEAIPTAWSATTGRGVTTVATSRTKQGVNVADAPPGMTTVRTVCAFVTREGIVLSILHDAATCYTHSLSYKSQHIESSSCQRVYRTVCNIQGVGHLPLHS